MLDAQGGTEIVAILPQDIRFTQGRASLVCMSLSEKGLLRWYTSCCNTAVANTPRDFRTSYAGLIHSCLGKSSPSLDDSFGPVRMVLQTKSAKGQVKSTPVNNFVALLSIMRAVIGARLRGSYKHNPFFASDTGKPVKQPLVLTEAERARLSGAD